jgi:CheY-like chemotaxis protein
MEDKKDISILAIDDNPTQLKIYENILSSIYEITLVKSAADALRATNLRIFNLILLDIEMPDVSGFEFLHEIRKNPKFISTPVIFITSHSESELLSLAENTSASGVLVKPIIPENLLKAIDLALSTPLGDPFKL